MNLIAASPVLLGALATMATLFGGLIAARLHRSRGLILGLSAGLVAGVAVFDLLPDALRFGARDWSLSALASFVAVGLIAYASLLRLPVWQQAWRSHLAPALLTLHSLIDGIGIGVAFKISQEAGWIVAAAVLSHDLADGVNIVSFTQRAGDPGGSRLWLGMNGIAPLVGVILGGYLAIDPAALGPVLATLAGAFLYIGLVDLASQGISERGLAAIPMLMIGMTVAYVGAALS